jgi:hypothetical protein
VGHGGVVATDDFGQREAIEAGHHYIGHHNIGALLAK